MRDLVVLLEWVLMSCHCQLSMSLPHSTVGRSDVVSLLVFYVSSS